MKKILLILSIILCLLGCSNEQQLDGTIVVRISDDSGARIITSGESPISMDVDHYEIMIDENKVGTIEKKSEGSSFRKGVEPGQHNVTVNAYNADDDLIGNGTNTVSVANGAIVQCDITVTEISGNGSITISLDNLSKNNDDYLAVEVINLQNSSVIAEYKFNSVSEFQNQLYTFVNIPNGFYSIRFYATYKNTYETKTDEYQCEMPIRVIAGKNSKLLCTFDPDSTDLSPYIFEFKPTFELISSMEFNLFESNEINISYDKNRYEISGVNVQFHYNETNDFSLLSSEEYSYQSDSVFITPQKNYLDTGTVDFRITLYIIDNYTQKQEDYDYYLFNVEIGEQTAYHKLSIDVDPEVFDMIGAYISPLGHDVCDNFSVQWYVNGVAVYNDFDSGIQIVGNIIRINEIKTRVTRISATVTDTINGKQITDELSVECVWENYNPYKSLMNHMYFYSFNGNVAEFRFDPRYMPEEEVMLYSLNAEGEKVDTGVLINSAKLFSYDDGSQYYAIELPLASDCQFGTYIPILAETYSHGIKQNEYLNQVYLFGSDSVSVNLIPSKSGYYSYSERPYIEVTGLERYASWEGYRIEYWLGNAEKKVITDYSGPVELKLPDYSKDNSYVLNYRIVAYSGDYEYTIAENSLFFNYCCDGIPALPLDKVYFLSQNEPYGDIERNYSYYLMTTDGTNYYYFNDYRGYDRGWDSGAYYGFSKAYMNMMNEYELNVIRTSIGTYDRVSFRYGDNGDVQMSAGPALKLLNKGSVTNSYTGNWEFTNLELGITETKKILDLLVNDSGFAENLIPDADRLVSTTRDVKTVFDIKASVSSDKITISVVLKSGVSGLDGNIATVSEYRPFAEITLPIQKSAKGEPEIVCAKGRVGLQVSKDGSVLVLKAMRDGILIPIPLIRTTTSYVSPAVTSSHFSSNMVVTEQSIVDAVYEIYSRVYPEQLAELDNNVSSRISVSGESYDWSGKWKVGSSSNILDNSELVIFGNEALFIKDGTSLFGECSENSIDFTSKGSWKLEIKGKSLNYGELVLNGNLVNEKTSTEVTVRLSKQSKNSIEVLAAVRKAEGYSFNQAVFSADGSISVSTTERFEVNERVIGSYSVDNSNSSLTIQIDPALYDVIIPYSSDPHNTGARLGFRNNRIQLFAGLDGLLLTSK